MRLRFDEELGLLNKEMITMASLCENAIAMAAKSLTEADPKLAKGVPELSVEIDHKEREIEGMCLKLLLQQQPVARDLRVISSALKMVTDIERIGDQAADIAEIVSMENITVSDDTDDINRMAMAVIRMVTESVDAFVKKDVDLAHRVIAYDDVVDDCFDRVKKTLIERFSKSGSDGEYALDLLMIAKYFERIGDHAANIANWVIFSITGSREGETV